MTETQTKKKVPILTTAMAIMGTGTTLVGKGQYIEGGLLILGGLVCIMLYEAYQVRELPEPLTDEMIEKTVDTVADEIKQNTELDEFLGIDDSNNDATKDATSDGFGNSEFGDEEFGGSSSDESTATAEETVADDVTIDTDHSSDVSETASEAPNEQEEVSDEDMDISAAEVQQ